MTITQMFEKNGPPPSTIDWRAWLQRWDAQQTGYLPDREERRAFPRRAAWRLILIRCC